MSQSNSQNYKTKSWYRAVKVLYVVVFLVVLSLVNYQAMNNRYELNTSESYIRCNIGDKKTVSIAQSGITFENDELMGYKYKDFYINPKNQFKVENIIELCTGLNYRNLKPEDGYGVSFANIFDLQRFTDIGHANQSMERIDKISLYNDEKIKDPLDIMIAYSFEIFDIKADYEANKLYANLWIINLIIIFSFIVLPKLFHYIFKPAINETK